MTSNYGSVNGFSAFSEILEQSKKGQEKLSQISKKVDKISSIASSLMSQGADIDNIIESQNFDNEGFIPNSVLEGSNDVMIEKIIERIKKDIEKYGSDVRVYVERKNVKGVRRYISGIFKALRQGMIDVAAGDVMYFHDAENGYVSPTVLTDRSEPKFYEEKSLPSLKILFRFPDSHRPLNIIEGRCATSQDDEEDDIYENYDFEITSMATPKVHQGLNDLVTGILRSSKTQEQYEHQENLLEQFQEFNDEMERDEFLESFTDEELSDILESDEELMALLEEEEEFLEGRKYTAEQKKEASERGKKRWANLSDDEKNAIIQKMKDAWAKMPQEKKDKRNKRISKKTAYVPQKPKGDSISNILEEWKVRFAQVFSYNRKFLKKMKKEMKQLKGEVHPAFINTLNENQSWIFKQPIDVIEALSIKDGENPLKAIGDNIKSYLAEADDYAKKTPGAMTKTTLGELAFDAVAAVSGKKDVAKVELVKELVLSKGPEILDILTGKEAGTSRKTAEKWAAEKATKTEANSVLESYASFFECVNSMSDEEIDAVYETAIENIIENYSEEEAEYILESKGKIRKFSKNPSKDVDKVGVRGQVTDFSEKQKAQQDKFKAMAEEKAQAKQEETLALLSEGADPSLREAISYVIGKLGSRTFGQVVYGMASGAFSISFFISMQMFAKENGMKATGKTKNPIDKIESIRRGRSLAAYVTNYFGWVIRANQHGLFTGKPMVITAIPKKGDAPVRSKDFNMPNADDVYNTIDKMGDEVVEFLKNTARKQFWAGRRKTTAIANKMRKTAIKRVKKSYIFEDIALVTTLI